jgi:hypothetical protein
MLNPRAPRGAGVMINAGGVSPVRPFAYPAAVGDEILARFGPPPTTSEADASAKVDYAERVLREYVLTDLKPDVVLNWFTDRTAPSTSTRPARRRHSRPSATTTARSA